MSIVEIIVGSMMGGTEYVAEACDDKLQSLGLNTHLQFQPDYAATNKENTFWLICTSTHGAGDYPDNIRPFIDQLTQTTEDLSTVTFTVIGVGDSSYDTFCQAAKDIEKLLLSKGCVKKFDLLTIDMQQDIDPEHLATSWLDQHKDQLS